MNATAHFFAWECAVIEDELAAPDNELVERAYLQTRLDIVRHMASHTMTPGEALVELQCMIGAAECERDTIPWWHWRQRMAACEQVAIIWELYQRFCKWL